jgi:hypothetical protein
LLILHGQHNVNVFESRLHCIVLHHNLVSCHYKLSLVSIHGPGPMSVSGLLQDPYGPRSWDWPSTALNTVLCRTLCGLIGSPKYWKKLFAWSSGLYKVGLCMVLRTLTWLVFKTVPNRSGVVFGTEHYWSSGLYIVGLNRSLGLYIVSLNRSLGLYIVGLRTVQCRSL